MATVLVRVAGVDITSHVVFASASFESAVNGTVGSCKFRVRDDDRTVSLVLGSIIELLVDGSPVWTGYLTLTSRVYAFPAENVVDAGLARWFDVSGSDINTLFNKRIVFDAANPRLYGKTFTYPPVTADDTAIAELVANWLDLSGDSLDVATKVENVADINVDQDAQPWSAGQGWGQAMFQIASLPAAVYFLDPARFLVYTDVNTATAPFGLSDQPSTSGGTIYFEDDYTGSSPTTWPGWTPDPGSPLIVSGAATVAISEGSGVGTITTSVVSDANPTDRALTSFSAPCTTPLPGALTWRLTVNVQVTHVAGMSATFGLGLDGYAWGFDVAVNTDGSYNLDAFGPTNSVFGDTQPVWDDSQQVCELLKLTDGTVEFRLWPASGSRPSTPTLTFTDAEAIGAGTIVNLYTDVLSHGDVSASSSVVFDLVRLDDPTGGTTSVGYREMTLSSDGMSLINDELAWGTGYGSQSPVFKRITDAASLALHGRWQDGRQANLVYKQATIDRIADSVVNGSPSSQRGAKDDRIAVVVTTYVPGFLPAQKVDFTSNIFGFNDVIPIRKMRVTFDAPDKPKYVLTLSHAIDSPFGFVDPFLIRLPKLPKITIPNFLLPDCGITDTFTRVVTGAWGRSDSGLEWQGFPDTGSSASVNGATGQLVISDPDVGNGLTEILSIPSVQYPVVFQFLVTEIPSSGVNGPIAVRLRPQVTNVVTVSLSSDFDTAFGSPRGGFVELTGGSGAYVSKTDWSTGWYNYEEDDDGVNHTVTIWPVGNPKPAPLLTDTTYGPGTDFTLEARIIRTGADTPGHAINAYLDNLNIPHVNRCLPCATVFDDAFDRTNASSWGTSSMPLAVAWVPTYDIGTSSDVAYSVDGAHGIISFLTGATVAVRNNADISAARWINGQWSLSFEATFSGSGAVLAQVGAGDPRAPISFVAGLDFDLAATGSFIRLHFSTASGSLLGSTVAFDGWNGAAINYRVTLDFAHHTLLGRYWNVGDPEPTTWQTTLDLSTWPYGPLTTDELPTNLVSVLSQTTTVGSTASFDFIRVECGGTAVSLNCGSPGDHVTEFLGDSGGGVLQTSCSYQPGSVRLYRNALLQRPGTDYTETSPAGGTITLADPLGPSDVVEALYQSGGLAV